MENIFHRGRTPHAAHKPERHTGGFPNGPCIVKHVRLPVGCGDARRHLSIGTVGHPMADFDMTEALGFECFYDLDTLFNGEAIRVLRIVPASQLNHDGKIVIHPASHRTGDSNRKSHPVFKTPTPFVGASIALGRQKLRYKIAMGTMDLNTVKSCFLNPTCRLSKGIDNGFNVFIGQVSRLCSLIGKLFGHRHRDQIAIGLGHGGCAGTPMDDLHDDFPVDVMDGLCHFLISGDMIIILYAVHIDKTLTVLLNIGISGHNQSHIISSQLFH